MRRLAPALLLAALLLAALAARPAAADPDLVLDLASTVPSFDLRSFSPDACELQSVDRCIDQPGARKLLRFGVLAINRGDDLVVGVPSGADPKWVFSSCHNHYHFETFARYELRRADGTGTPIPGQKRSFCVEDTKAAGSTNPRKYCCTPQCQNVQGIQRDWGDLYPDTLPCQWIDVTDTPPGDYRLCIEINFDAPFRLPESSFDNNSGCIDVTIAAPVPKLAPRVRVSGPHRNAKVRVGKKLRVAWQRKVAKRSTVLFQEVWYSADGGATWTFVTNAVGAKARTYRWTVPAQLASDDARVRVVVAVRNDVPPGGGAGAFQTAAALSGRFRVVP
jgi:hypothetical protein